MATNHVVVEPLQKNFEIPIPETEISTSSNGTSDAGWVNGVVVEAAKNYFVVKLNEPIIVDHIMIYVGNPPPTPPLMMEVID